MGPRLLELYMQVEALLVFYDLFYQFVLILIRGGIHLKGARSHIYAAPWDRECYHTSYESYGCPLSSDIW